MASIIKELFKIPLSKTIIVSATIALIVFPPFVYFFHFNEELFMEMDFLKLLLLTVGPSAVAMAVGILLNFSIYVVGKLLNEKVLVYDDSVWLLSSVMTLIWSLFGHYRICRGIANLKIVSIDALIDNYWEQTIFMMGFGNSLLYIVFPWIERQYRKLAKK